MSVMQPSIRKPLGVFAILFGLAVYGGAIGHFAGDIATLPSLVQTLVYLLLGVVWLLPLRPLLVWMNR